jgi:hypothetical protein
MGGRKEEKEKKRGGRPGRWGCKPAGHFTQCNVVPSLINTRTDHSQEKHRQHGEK